MQNRTKTSIILVFGIIALLGIVPSFFAAFPMKSSSGGGPDFYVISREVSLNEMIEKGNEYNLSIYLPAEIPDNLELTAIYLRNWSFLAIVVYSAEGNKDYKTAEFVIQITPTSDTPTYEEISAEAGNSADVLALEINGWPTIIYERASSGGNIETRDKWGNWLLLVRLWIEGIRYNLVAPTLCTDDVIEVIENMSSFL